MQGMIGCVYKTAMHLARVLVAAHHSLSGYVFVPVRWVSLFMCLLKFLHAFHQCLYALK